jgi:hypothetical protein
VLLAIDKEMTKEVLAQNGITYKKLSDAIMKQTLRLW